MTIFITLPPYPARDIWGTLEVWIGNGNFNPKEPYKKLFECRALGKSDQHLASMYENPNRNPLLPFGDTPCGAYRVKLKDGNIELHPLTGDALEARNISGRMSSDILDGKPGDGGVRIATADLQTVRRLISVQELQPSIICEVLETIPGWFK
jgi:hypothetical protein